MSDDDQSAITKGFDPSYRPEDIVEKIDSELDRQEQKLDELDDEFFINEYLGRANAKKNKKPTSEEDKDKEKTDDDELTLIASEDESEEKNRENNSESRNEEDDAEEDVSKEEQEDNLESRNEEDVSKEEQEDNLESRNEEDVSKEDNSESRNEEDVETTEIHDSIDGSAHDSIDGSAHDSIDDDAFDSKENITEDPKVKTKEISEPTPTMPKIQIEVKKKPENYVDNGLSEKEIEKKKEEVLLNISKQVEQLEAKELNIDYELYSRTINNKYVQFLYIPVSISVSVPAGKLSLEQIIPSLTTFKYKSFNTPAVELLHTVPEKVIALKKLNSIFNYEFIDVSKTNRDFHLKDTDEVIANFFETRLRRVSPLSIEYVIFTKFLQKLLFSLCSYEDLSFLTDTIQTNIQFKRILYTDFEIIKKTYAPKTRMRIAHDYIMKTINDTTVGAMIYKYKDYKDLNSKIELAANRPKEFLLEQLFASLLKTCLPSVSLSYLYAIRSCEVLCRFIGLYLQEERYVDKNTNKNKPFMEVVDDLYYISTIAISLYEHEWSLMTQCVRSFPTVRGTTLKPETREYINSHMLSSGVYLLLKMLEKSVPVIAQKL